MRLLKSKRSVAQDKHRANRVQKRKFVVHERECVAAMQMIADDVVNVRLGTLGAIEAICNIQIYLDDISWSDGDPVFLGNRFCMQPPQPAPASTTLPQSPVGEVAGAGSGRQQTEMQTVPHTLCDIHAGSPSESESGSVPDEMCHSCEKNPICQWTYPECDDCYQEHTG